MESDVPTWSTPEPNPLNLGHKTILKWRCALIPSFIVLPLPMCGWSESMFAGHSFPRYLILIMDTDQREFDIGAANQENVRLLLGSLALYPFTELLGYVRHQIIQGYPSFLFWACC